MRKTITDNGSYTCVEGDTLTVLGSATPVITQSGGEVCTHDTSSPRITQSGGMVWIRDTSTPRIIQSGVKSLKMQK